ncbi:MAG: hypothetical protein JOZ92_06290 [Candidatus Dormibacteraeota bacterium]|nr:hypothetical protein [Candidatus Dormibacteraeota bacterium]
MLAPVSGALTYPAPHGLRGAVMLPFLFILAAYGARLVLRIATQRRRAAIGVLAAGLITQGGLYMLDYYTAYPVRASYFFDTGVQPAIATAERLAGGHTVWLSDDIEQAYIQAFFVLQPAPPRTPMADTTTLGLAKLNMQLADAAQPTAAASPGDILVLPSADPAPPDAMLLSVEYAPADPLAPAARVALLGIYRVT